MKVEPVRDKAFLHVAMLFCCVDAPIINQDEKCLLSFQPTVATSVSDTKGCNKALLSSLLLVVVLYPLERPKRQSKTYKPERKHTTYKKDKTAQLAATTDTRNS